MASACELEPKPFNLWTERQRAWDEPEYIRALHT